MKNLYRDEAVTKLKADLDAARKEVKEQRQTTVKYIEESQALEFENERLKAERDELRGLLEIALDEWVSSSVAYLPRNKELQEFRRKARAALGNRLPICDGCKLDGDCAWQRGQVAMGPDAEVSGKCVIRERSDDAE